MHSMSTALRGSPPWRWWSGRVFAIYVAMLLLPPGLGCGSGEREISSSIRGTLSYRERMALPPEASAHVALLDISMADAPAKMIAERSIDGPLQIPIAFELPYDTSRIDPVRRYAIRAQITVSGQLLFTTTEVHPVLTHGAPDSLEVMLHRNAPPADDAMEAATGGLSAEEGRLEGRTWLVEDLAGRGVIDILQTTIRFESEGRTTGMAGCNQFQGTYEVKGDSLRFGPLAATQKMCPAAVMDQEERFLRFLGGVDRFSFDDVGFLLLYAPDEGSPTRLSPLEER